MCKEGTYEKRGRQQGMRRHVKEVYLEREMWAG